MLFGDRLKMLREDKDITQKQLGQIVGVSDRVIGYYESNNRFPKDENTLKSLADYFGVSLDYLLGRNSESHILISNENKNIDEIIEDFESALNNAMLNGEKMDERTKELFKQSLRNVYDFIAPKDKK